MPKRSGGIIGCKYKTSSWRLNGFPYGSNFGSTEYNIGEKPTVILYTYINRHAGTLLIEKQRKQKQCSTSSNMVVIIYCYTLSRRFVPASPNQGHDRPCRRDVGRVFLAGVRSDSPSRRRIPSCYRPGPGRGVVVELGQRGAH